MENFSLEKETFTKETIPNLSFEKKALAKKPGLPAPRNDEWANPFGDGTAGERIVTILEKELA